MDVVKWLAFATVVIYATIVAAMYVGQRSLLFPLRPERTAPAQAGFPEAQEHILMTQDGERLVTWLRPPAGPENPLFLMFLGNGDNLGMIARHLRQMTEDGSGVLAVAYRGYSGSTGSPSEFGLTQNAEAAYRFAASVVPANRIVLFGYSLARASPCRSRLVTRRRRPSSSPPSARRLRLLRQAIPGFPCGS